MIDLHIHTYYSDGTSSVTEILKEAQKLNLEVISITDHETVDAYNELKNINVSDFYTGKIITGVELKTRYKDFVIDVLGYNINIDEFAKRFKEVYKNTSRSQIQEEILKEFYNYGATYNLTLKPIEELNWNKHTDWASIIFYNEMKNHIENKSILPEDLWESFTNFKKNYYNIKGNMFYINRSIYYPTLKEIINLIHSSNGLAFIAHIFEYNFLSDKISELEHIKNNYNIDGIECFYSTFTPIQTNSLISFCENNNLLMSGGSDYHGNNKKDITLALGKGSLHIHSNIINNWHV